MLRLATQKRRLKAKVQEIADDDILEVRASRPVLRSSPVSEIAAFPNYAHDEPTRPFVGRIESWKLPPPPRIPVLRSFLPRASLPRSDSSVPPVAIPATTIPVPRKGAAAATQKIRAALGDVTENTLLIVQGRPSVAWAAGLLAVGMCFGAFLARPGRNELASAAQVAPESAAPEVLMALAPTRAPTVAEVSVPIPLAPSAPAAVEVAPVQVVVAPKPAAVKPLAKKGSPAIEPSARTKGKDASALDALAREQLKSALR